MTDFFVGRFQTIRDFFSTQRLWPETFWGDIFTWNYWTEADLLTRSPYVSSFIGGAIVVVITLLLWRARLKKAHLQTPVFEEPINQLFTLNILVITMTLTYLFFRSQGIVYFSSRLTVLLSLAVIIIWAIGIGIYTRRVSLARRVQYLEKERFFRYLPKKKVKPQN